MSKNQLGLKKNTKSGKAGKATSKDDCQSPVYAVWPILPYLPKHWKIWESAVGKGNIKKELIKNGYQVLGTDVKINKNFFSNGTLNIARLERVDCIVTNPPYSILNEWLDRCFEIKLPFALLLRTEIISNKGFQRKIKNNGGIAPLFVGGRIDFETPNMETEQDKKESSSWFPTSWFCWNLPDLPHIDLKYFYTLPTNKEIEALLAGQQKMFN